MRGAHTLGFNATSCGVSVIGNFDQTKPTDAILAALAQVAAWKLSRYGRDPLGTIKVVSEGSDKFARNRTVTLPVIDGHRDTNDTACPGSNLYARLDDLRAATQALLEATTVPTVTVTQEFTISGTPSPGSTLTVGGATFAPASATATYVWLRDGVPIRRSTKVSRRVSVADVGHVLSVVVTLSAEGYAPATRRIDLTEPVRYSPTVAVTAGSDGPRVTVTVTVTADGVADPGGTAVIRVDARVKEVPVVAGQARAVFTRPAGEHPVSVAYSGSALVRPGVAETTVTTA